MWDNHEQLGRAGIASHRRDHARLADEILNSQATSHKVLDGLEAALAACDGVFGDLGASGPRCPKCGTPTTLLVKGRPGDGNDLYACGCGWRTYQ